MNLNALESLADVPLAVAAIDAALAPSAAERPPREAQRHERPGLRPALSILGTRGIPARHGGFETFAERLALYLVERGWDVTVYCQDERRGETREEFWNGVRLVRIAEPRTGAWGTAVFDLKSTRQAARKGTTILTLGYNTALFCACYRLRGRTNLINMDGLEWQRAKWSLPVRAWLYVNERLACWLGNRLIADHPEIAAHLGTRVRREKITTIPYGADTVMEADASVLESHGLATGGYALVIARPEPENSLEEIVSAFSARRRGVRLVVLGRYQPQSNPYHRRVLEAAGREVLFPGVIYDQRQLAALRLFARLYVHGHTVGGTNPALVEALGSGCPVLAHDNRFNRWVAGPAARFFAGRTECEAQLSALLDDSAQLEQMRSGSRGRHAEAFTWQRVLTAYEELLAEFARVGGSS